MTFTGHSIRKDAREESHVVHMDAPVAFQKYRNVVERKATEALSRIESRGIVSFVKRETAIRSRQTFAEFTA